jgi:hypothetical protein
LVLAQLLSIPIDADARSFYERFDFERCPENAMHLMLLMKDLRVNLRQQ